MRFSAPSTEADLAAEQPAKLAELKALFQQEAGANQVLPISGPRMLKRNLPELSAGVIQASYYPGAVGVPETALPKTANRSWSISANVAAKPEARGVLAAVGGGSAGWSLYLDQERHAVFRYKVFDLQTVELRSPAPLPPGDHELRVDFAYAGPGFAKGGELRLNIDGQPAASGRVAATSPGPLTIDETFDVGIDRGSPAGRYPADAGLGYAFAGGDIRRVDIVLK